MQSAPTRIKINHPEGVDNTFFSRNIWTNLILNCARTQNIIIWVTPGIKICKLTRNKFDNETYEVVFIHSCEQLIQQRAVDGAVCGLATSAARRYWSGPPPTTTYVFYIITKRSRSAKVCKTAAVWHQAVSGFLVFVTCLSRQVSSTFNVFRSSVS